MGVVVGTAGHIDHGKTTLLRALTGIDADRLPEERRRGMTIDVGYAHLSLPDGTVLDFVDVPGHDRLVGNMLVGAGEVDAALLVVAADDGPNAQTLEHLELLDAIGISLGVVAVTKVDAVDGDRAADVERAVAGLVGRTRLAGSPVLAVSGVTGEGIDALRAELLRLRDRVLAAGEAGAVAWAGDDERVGGDERVGVDERVGDAAAVAHPTPARPRLAIDRVFAVKGRGTVVTGSLRGGAVRAGDVLRLVPGGREVRVREVQERGSTVAAAGGGRTALLLAGVDADDLRRGRVLTTDPSVVETSRVLVAVRPAVGLAPGARPSVPADRERLRLHLGTEGAGALVVRGPREAVALDAVEVGAALAILRLDAPIAAAPGDRFALRRPSPGSAAGGGWIVDALPPRGVSRRRLTPERAVALAAAPLEVAARLELHGAVRDAATRDGGGWRLAGDVEAALSQAAVSLVRGHHEADPSSAGMPVSALRAELAVAARRRVTLGRAGAEDVARAVVDGLVTGGALARDGDRLRDPARAAGLPAATLAAMDRLESALAVAAPPSLAAAVREAGCPPEGLRALLTAGRIVRLEGDLAWAASTYRDLVRRALSMAAAGPLTPAAFRDATGTSRKYVLVILEDLDRRGLLRRTDAGHVLGPATIAKLKARAAAQSSSEPAVTASPPPPDPAG
jgi:selenocysteine-specific elongation factor